MRFWRALGGFGRTLVFVVLGLGLLSLDWRGRHAPSAPVVVGTMHADGPLRAGAAMAELVPPFPTPIGGYNTRGSAPFEGVLDPPHARAIVLEVGGRRLALVSVELVVLPAALREKIVARVAALGLDDVVIAATHTHAGVGGYWDSRLAGWMGLGAYDPKAEAFLVDRVAAALHDAAGRLVPARLSVGRIDASNYGANRNVPGGPVDTMLTGARFTDLEGKVLARLVVFAVHPTIVHRDSMRLSGDWPASMSTTLEADGGVTLFWQGACGDTTWGKRGGNMGIDERVVRFGQAVASDARAALGAGGEGVSQVALDHARVRLAMPPADTSGLLPGPLVPLTSNVLHWLAWPPTTEVSFTRVGPLLLAAIPGEVVADLGMAWREKLGGPTIVGLADAYVGYVETPERIAAQEGEARRSYFGPDLAPALFAGLVAAKAAAEARPSAP